MAESQIAGSGLFMGEHVLPVQLIIEYTGERISPELAATRSDIQYQMTVGNVVVDGRNGGIAKFANHSCCANAEYMVMRLRGSDEVDVAFIYPKKKMKMGDEIVVDYGWTATDGGVTVVCECGMPNCIGTIGN